MERKFLKSFAVTLGVTLASSSAGAALNATDIDRKIEPQYSQQSIGAEMVDDYVIERPTTNARIRMAGHSSHSSHASHASHASHCSGYSYC